MRGTSIIRRVSMVGALSAILVGLTILLMAPAAQASVLDDACKVDDPDERLVRLAAALARIPTKGLQPIDMTALKARMIPDYSAQAFEIPEQIVLANSEIVPLMMEGTPSRSDFGEMKDRPDANTTNDLKTKRKLVSPTILLVEDYPQLPSETTQKTTRVRLDIPGVGRILPPFWTARHSTIAIIVCPRLGISSALSASAYVAIVYVSGFGWAFVDVILCITLLYLFSAAVVTFARRKRIPKASFWKSLDPVIITQDLFGFGSISRLQILYFTLVVAATLLYIFLRAGFLSEISSQLLYLLGIAAAGTALAKTVATYRAESDDDLTFTTDRWLQRHLVSYPPRDGQWRDLLETGREFDVYKFQVLAFSVLVGAWILTSGFSNLAGLTIPDNVMALLGLSQVVYVGGKIAAGTPGRKELNQAVKDAVEAEIKFWAAVPPGDPYVDNSAKAWTEVQKAVDSLGTKTGPDARASARLQGLQTAGFGSDWPAPPANAANEYRVFKDTANKAMSIANQVLDGAEPTAVEPRQPSV